MIFIEIENHDTNRRRIVKAHSHEDAFNILTNAGFQHIYGIYVAQDELGHEISAMEIMIHDLADVKFP